MQLFHREKETVRKKHRKRTHPLVHFPNAGARSWEFNSTFSKWVEISQTLRPSLPPPKAYVSRKLESAARSGSKVRNSNIGQLNQMLSPTNSLL